MEDFTVLLFTHGILDQDINIPVVGTPADRIRSGHCYPRGNGLKWNVIAAVAIRTGDAQSLEILKVSKTLENSVDFNHTTGQYTIKRIIPPVIAYWLMMTEDERSATDSVFVPGGTMPINTAVKVYGRSIFYGGLQQQLNALAKRNARPCNSLFNKTYIKVNEVNPFCDSNKVSAKAAYLESLTHPAQKKGVDLIDFIKKTCEDNKSYRSITTTMAEDDFIKAKQMESMMTEGKNRADALRSVKADMVDYTAVKQDMAGTADVWELGIKANKITNKKNGVQVARKAGVKGPLTKDFTDLWD